MKTTPGRKLNQNYTTYNYNKLISEDVGVNPNHYLVCLNKIHGATVTVSSYTSSD